MARRCNRSRKPLESRRSAGRFSLRIVCHLDPSLAPQPSGALCRRGACCHRAAPSDAGPKESSHQHQDLHREPQLLHHQPRAHRAAGDRRRGGRPLPPQRPRHRSPPWLRLRRDGLCGGSRSGHRGARWQRAGRSSPAHQRRRGTAGPRSGRASSRRARSGRASRPRRPAQLRRRRRRFLRLRWPSQGSRQEQGQPPRPARQEAQPLTSPPPPHLCHPSGPRARGVAAFGPGKAFLFNIFSRGHPLVGRLLVAGGLLAETKAMQGGTHLLVPCDSFPGCRLVVCWILLPKQGLPTCWFLWVPSLLLD